MGASGLRGFHLHDYALDVLGWKDRAAFITAVFSNLSDKLDQAAAAIRAEFFVGDDREAWHAPILPEGVFWPVLDGWERTTRCRPEPFFRAIWRRWSSALDSPLSRIGCNAGKSINTRS